MGAGEVNPRLRCSAVCGSALSSVKAQGAGRLWGPVGGLLGSVFWGYSSVHRRQGSLGMGGRVADQPRGVLEVPV